MRRARLRPAVVVLLVAGLAACSRADPAHRDAQGAVPVMIAEAARKDVPVRVDAIGTAEAYTTVDIKSQIGGELQEVHFREGQEVRQGDLLFTIDPRPYEAALEQAKAALARDRVQLETARRDAARYVDLARKEYVTQEEYERIRSNAEALEAVVRADEAAVVNAGLQLEYCAIRSLIAGRTGQLMVHRGNLIKANADTPMVVINQIDPIYVAFSVPEQDLPEIKARRAAGDLAVQASVPGEEGEPATGRLTFVDNKVDRATGTVLLKATLENHDRRFWPGQFVNARLVLAMRHDAIVVPSQAIQTGQQGSFVFVVKPDLTVESRSVVVGATLDQEAVIDKGLAAAEKVVTDGQINLVPGARVEPKNGVGSAAQNGTGSAAGARP